MGFETTIFPRTRFCRQTELRGRFRPFVDWTYSNNRARFQREIDGATALIAKPDRLAAVVLLGFSGYHNDIDPADPWNEELVPTIRRLRASGFNDVFMAVHEAQAARRSDPNRGAAYELMREMERDNRLEVYHAAGDFADDLFSRYSRRFPYNYAENEYALWRRQWYLNEKEALHV